MRVLLVVYDPEMQIGTFPLGLGYISGVLKRAGHEVVVYSQDQHHYPPQHLTDLLDRDHFDMVGLSFIGGYQPYRQAIKIAAAVDAARDKPFFVLGGHGPAPEPEFFLKKLQADVVVIGEGEATAVELMAALGDPRRLAQVAGLAWREGDRVTINPRRPLIAAIDAIPHPAYELFPIDYYRLRRSPNIGTTDFYMPVLSGRGCNFHCNFCYRMDEGFRPRSGEAIIEEIRLLQKDHGITYVSFLDELLMSSEARTVELCEAFLGSGLRFKWWCNGRLNYAKPDILALMKRAGCVFVNYGIEAFDDQILRNMNKALTTAQVIRGVEATLAAGISPGLNIIFGNLGENLETLEKGVQFLLNYSDGAQLRTIRPVTPYPGTPLYYLALEKGLLKDVEDFYENKHLNADLVAVNFTDLTDEDIHRALLAANERLIRAYFEKKMALELATAADLYLNRNTRFRGFRQT